MDKALIELLESKGAATVLLEMAQGSHGMAESRLREEVEFWLRSKQILADLASSAKRDAREEATLSIARSANRIASEARTAAFEQARWAKWAAIIAAIAAIIAIIAIITTIFWR